MSESLTLTAGQHFFSAVRPDDAKETRQILEAFYALAGEQRGCDLSVHFVDPAGGHGWRQFDATIVAESDVARLRFPYVATVCRPDGSTIETSVEEALSVRDAMRGARDLRRLNDVENMGRRLLTRIGLHRGVDRLAKELKRRAPDASVGDKLMSSIEALAWRLTSSTTLHARFYAGAKEANTRAFPSLRLAWPHRPTGPSLDIGVVASEDPDIAWRTRSCGRSIDEIDKAIAHVTAEFMHGSAVRIRAHWFSLTPIRPETKKEAAR